MLACLCALAAVLGFGMARTDAARVRAFADAVRGWQVSPDYRAVSREYVRLGVEAMQARLCGISAGRVVMGFRSLPGLPDHLALSETSADHYQAFSRGELSAYLHLASEQGIGDGVVMVERLAERLPPSDGDIVAFLAGFKLPVPTVTDAGAVAGVRRLLADVGTDPFAVRADLATRLRSHVDRDLAVSTRAQEAEALAHLDDDIRASDVELWRAKQVGDFLAGVWAQGYGQIYLDGIEGFFRIQRAARFAFAIAVPCLVGLLWSARRRSARDRAATSADRPAGAVSA